MVVGLLAYSAEGEEGKEGGRRGPQRGDLERGEDGREEGKKGRCGLGVWKAVAKEWRERRRRERRRGRSGG